MKRALKLTTAMASAAGASLGVAHAAVLGGVSLDPTTASAVGAASLAAAAALFIVKLARDVRRQSLKWSERLAIMEGRLEKAESVLAAHPGLVIVWEDTASEIGADWGRPRVLGGPAALASMLALSGDDPAEPDPVRRLLNALGALPLDEHARDPDKRPLADKIRELRNHGVGFAGVVYSEDGRPIEVDGRAAGGQVALWLTDPAARMAEDGGGVGRLSERAADLHAGYALLERSPIPMWRRDADLKLIWANRAYAEAVEAASPADAVRRQLELASASPRLAAKAKVENARRENRFSVAIGGVQRILRVVETPLHGAGDAAVGGMAIDITDAQRAKKDLARHLEAHHRTLDQIPAAVAVFGAKQELAFYNKAFQALWKLDDADLAGRPKHADILDRLHERGALPPIADYATWRGEQLALYTAEANDAADAKAGAAPEAIWTLPGGRSLRVASQRHPLGGVLVVFEDITERLDLETRFNTVIKVQKATLDNLSEAVAVFGGDGRLRLGNDAFAALFGMKTPSEGVSAVRIDDLAKRLARIAPEAGGLAESLVRRVTSLTSDGRAPLREAETPFQDGRTFVASTEPLPDGATLIVFQDVTDTREREKELRERNAWLEAADRVKSKFVDHVSYQLRNPLNTIIGFSEMLESEMFGALNERQKDYASSVLSAANHLLDLINDVIDLAAIDAGRLTLEVSELDVRRVLENAATYAALKAEDTQVSLKLDCPKDIGVLIADEKRLKQVLFNLLSNAFAFTPPGGTVTLSARRDGDAIRIGVADTGRGVSPADQSRAFDRFESAGPGAGAGLGLALVQSFVELHGGWVRMESVAGEGTRVACHFPADGPVALAEEDDATMVDGTAEIISDEPTDAEDLQRRAANRAAE
ncbi:MAG: ATP-binding protein [Pseudomonadota bacterium]